MNRHIEPHGYCKAKTLRSAEKSDLPELTRLFCSMLAEVGRLHEIDTQKANAAFQRGIDRERSMLVVASGSQGRLNGFLLLGSVEPWFSNTTRVQEICLCIDRGHLRSRGARELREFAAYVRKDDATRKASKVAPTVARAPEPQNCTAQTQPANDLNDAMGLLQKLASRNRPSGGAASPKSNGDASGCAGSPVREDGAGAP
jgi:hypothetical protein